MAILKRVSLFLLVNFAIVAFISFLLRVFNIQPYLTQYGINFGTLAIFCLIWGFAGSLISLFLSKTMAKSMMGVQIIDPKTVDPSTRELVTIVHDQARKAGLPALPEVGIYNSPEVNAFATGPSRSDSLVAVSTGLLRRLNRDQVEGVLGHEVSHVANGDMVTMTLLQGIINSFVLFFARAIAFILSRALGARDGEGSPMMFFGASFVLEMVFLLLGTLIVAGFSRRREYRADFGGARLASPEKMISALQGLKRTYEVEDLKTDQPAFETLKISGHGGFSRFLATHPPLDARIASLKARYRL
jgi:heat shock protein HtpX